MNPLWEKLSQGNALIGTFCRLGSVDAAEIASHAGFDFVVIDWQHGTFNVDQVRESVHCIHQSGAVPIIRLPNNGSFSIEWVLDMGYLGLIIPMINSETQAQSVVDQVLYPPGGKRSQAGCRAEFLYGKKYRQQFNQQVMLFLMIEHCEALPKVPQIASTPGVSGCFIGPTDLMSSKDGKPEYRISTLEEDIQYIRQATLQAGKIAGITVREPEELQRRISEGFRFLILSSDRAILMQYFQDLLKRSALIPLP
jgi:4-hydroxy-2-oxoheptanedioate aldolase